MGKNLPFDVGSSAEAVLAEVRSLIERRGGTMNGDSFAVMGVKGKYLVQGATLTVTISKKPFLVPMRLIEHVAKRQFTDICEKARAK